MKAERLQQVSPIFRQAVELPPDERAAFLDAACRGDAALRRDVERLISAHERAGSFIESPAYERAAGLLTGEPTAFAAGQVIEHYRIVAPLGRGGMGEVYLADDTRLGRPVALKLLSAHFTLDEEHVRRFRQEAYAASALNHPNIVTIYEIGKWQGRHFIATEFVDGITLRGRLRRGRLPLAEALDIALQIAGALSAAHDAGIIHRDLKPENIMLRKDGYLKILDFGIAKYSQPTTNKRGAREALVVTKTGAVIGTAAYMSPEQARGQEVDARTDIWSLGVILYEMVALRLPFPGPTPTDRLAAILEHEPSPLTKLRRGVPVELERIVTRALAKKKDERYGKMADVVVDLRRLRGTLADERPVRFTLPSPLSGLPALSRAAMLIVLALLVGGIVAAGYFMFHSRRAVQRIPLRQHLVSTFAGSHSSASFSPDGSRIAFTSEAGGVQQVWTKDLSAGEPKQITYGDGDARRPRWSPAGDEIIYTRRAKGTDGIYSISPDGGTPRKIIEGGRNPNWSWDGMQLVFERGYDVWTASKDGSDQRRIDNVPPTDFLLADRMPALSPGGSHIAIFQNEKGPIGDYWIIPVSGGEARRLTFDHIFGGAPVWTPDGQFIIFPSQRAGSMTLWKVPVAGGPPEAVLTSAGEDTEPEISRDGRKLIYTNTRSSHTLMLTDATTRGSRELRESRVEMIDPSFSPDGSKIAFFGVNEEGDIHVFAVGADGKDLMQVTRGRKERNIHPHWSSDGSTIYFYQFHPTVSFRRISAQGGESTELVRGWEWGTHNGARVDPAGKRIIYTKMDKGAAAATMIRDIASGAETAFSLPLRHLRWSHDGQFVVGTDIPGRNWQLAEITVCAADGEACRRLAKGSNPHWSHDDARIYFFPFTEFDGESLWAVSREGGDERKIMDLRPMHPISDFFDISPQDQIVWVQYRQSKHELWLADLSEP
jgi:eukaryotic-like serine/threonine-protein kinase